MLAPGVLLNDRYRLDTRLATGGMGDVWRGTDLLLGRQVAVKVLLPALVAEPDFIARFRAEARIMAALHHPGIVQVYDCGEHPLAEGARADYLVMEYVAGEPLSQRIESAGRLGVAQTLSVVAQAARALHAAHSGGIVHRDVKPANLLIQPDGTVVLVDFGVARSAGMARITSTNAVPGTALYMAPEQAAGRPVSASTDIYALGAVAYHCLAGRPPYSGQNPLEVAIRHLHDEPPAPPADLPAPVAALLTRALAKAPTDRYPSAAAFAAAADAALATADATTTGGGIRPAGVAAPVSASGRRDARCGHRSRRRCRRGRGRGGRGWTGHAARPAGRAAEPPADRVCRAAPDPAVQPSRRRRRRSRHPARRRRAAAGRARVRSGQRRPAGQPARLPDRVRRRTRRWSERGRRRGRGRPGDARSYLRCPRPRRTVGPGRNRLAHRLGQPHAERHTEQRGADHSPGLGEPDRGRGDDGATRDRRPAQLTGRPRRHRRPIPDQPPVLINPISSLCCHKST